MERILTSCSLNGARRQPLQVFLWLLVVMSALGPGRWLGAAELHEARVTRIIKDVRLLPTQAVPRAAAVNDTVRSDTAVRTGADSRTELTFADQTLTRLGANSIFTFNEGTRNLDLGTGVMLLHVPKGSGGAKISTAAVTAAITGTTVLIEAHSGKSAVAAGSSTQDGDATPIQLGLVTRTAKPSNPAARTGYVKFISLEGTARVFLNGHPEESVLVHPGQMLILAPGAAHLPKLVEVDLKKLVASCLLITDFSPLASAPLIAEEIEKQQNEIAEGESPVVTDPTSSDVIDQALSGVVPASAGGVSFGPEFGPLNTITAPVPYVINSGTQIMTAPLITTAGVTNQGKIYRGVQIDGSASTYFFGSASAFDVASGFDALGEGGSDSIPMAAFKFTSLQITGNPTITVPPNGASHLGLISEGGITSGAPGGTLTFAGMGTVLLAAQNGSIILDSTVNFQDVPVLYLYARGAGSNIVLASPIMNAGEIRLFAEGSVQVNANESASGFVSFAGDFLNGTGIITADFFEIQAQNAINFALSQFMLGSNGFVFLTGGVINIDASANATLFTNAGSVFVTGTGINITGGTTMTFGNSTQADFEAGPGGIQASTMSFSHPTNGLTMNTPGDINVTGILGGAFISSGGNLTATADLASLQASAGGNINVTGNLTNTQLTSATGGTSTIMVGGTLTSREVEVTGNANADHVSVLLLNQNFTPSNSVLTAGAGGITPFISAGPAALHSWNVNTVQSNTAAPGINFNGNAFGPGANGGNLQISAQTQVFTAANGINAANFNGADAAGVPGSPGGGGGMFTLNAAGPISMATSISATTGIINTNDSQSGIGGTVNLNSASSAVTVDGSIQVSSSDAMGAANRRSSAAGGNINITSGANSGTVINVNNTAQLLALLENTAPGPGGLITINATSVTGSTTMNVQGTIQADQGAIDVRSFSDSGQINLTSTMMMADIIKVATLGDNSTLNIGAVSISAGTLLRLYAGSISPSNNSTINFNASCNLTGDVIDIAAHTVNIVGAGTMVTTSSQANVYAVVANYQGSGGSGGGGTGMFMGAGATTLPFLTAPPLGPPGGTATTLSSTALPKHHSPPTGPGRP